MKVHIRAGGLISRLACPSHPLRIKLSPNKDEALISIDAEALEGKSVPDRSFILYFRDQEIDKPKVVLEAGEESCFAMLSFFPEFIDPKQREANRTKIADRIKQAEGLSSLDTDGSLKYEEICKQPSKGEITKEESKEESKEKSKEESKGGENDEEGGLEMAGEYVFVIDRSGSMDGQRIELAKQALLLFMASLPEGSRFNVFSFGSNYSALFKD